MAKTTQESPATRVINGVTFTEAEYRQMIKPRSFWGWLADRTPRLISDAGMAAISVYTSLILMPIKSSDARKVALEALAYEKATGKNPLITAVEVEGFGAVEGAQTALEQSGAGVASVLSGFIGAVPAEITALLADATIDKAIAIGVEAHKFPKAEGTPSMDTSRRVLERAGLAPVLPAVPTLAFMQWRGRRELREEARRQERQARRRR